MRHRVQRLVPVALLCGALGAGLAGTAGPAAAASAMSPRILRADASQSPRVLVDIGVPPGGTVHPADFRLWENGTPRPVAVSQLPNQALRVALVLNTVTIPQTAQQAVHNAVSDFVARLPVAAETGLVAAGSDARVVQPLTADHSRFLSALGGTWLDKTSAGGPDMGSALDLALDQLTRDPSTRRAVVVSSYGPDSAELPADLGDRLKAAGVLVYVVPVPGTDPDPELTSLAADTGGAVDIPSAPASSPKPKPKRGAKRLVAVADNPLGNAFDSLGDDLLGQYRLSYTSTHAAQVGKSLLVRVALDGTTPKKEAATSVTESVTLVGTPPRPAPTRAAVQPVAAGSGGGAKSGLAAGVAVFLVVLITAVVALIGMRRRRGQEPAESGGAAVEGAEVLGSGPAARPVGAPPPAASAPAPERPRASEPSPVWARAAAAEGGSRGARRAGTPTRGARPQAAAGPEAGERRDVAAAAQAQPDASNGRPQSATSPVDPAAPASRPAATGDRPAVAAQPPPAVGGAPATPPPPQRPTVPPAAVPPRPAQRPTVPPVAAGSPPAERPGPASGDRGDPPGGTPVRPAAAAAGDGATAVGDAPARADRPAPGGRSAGDEPRQTGARRPGVAAGGGTGMDRSAGSGTGSERPERKGLGAAVRRLKPPPRTPAPSGYVPKYARTTQPPPDGRRQPPPAPPAPAATKPAPRKGGTPPAPPADSTRGTFEPRRSAPQRDEPAAPVSDPNRRR